jgi:hypothetical protein
MPSASLSRASAGASNPRIGRFGDDDFITAAEVDEARGIGVTYRPPGG